MVKPVVPWSNGTSKYNAKDARLDVQTAQSLNGEYLRDFTDSLLDQIKIRARHGYTHIETYESVHDIVILRLAELGFDCRYTGNQRDGYVCKISWD